MDTELRVGYKVFIRDAPMPSLRQYIGTIGTIIRIDEDGKYWVRCQGGTWDNTWPFKESQLKLMYRS